MGKRDSFENNRSEDSPKTGTSGKKGDQSRKSNTALRKISGQSRKTPQKGLPPPPLPEVASSAAKVESGPFSGVPVAEADPARDTINLTDEELMRLCQDGYERAFDILFDRYQEPALSFIQRMTGDASRVEALGQEAFLRLFREAKSYQYPRRFATWFYTIVRNLCKNELRWRSRHPTVSLDEPSSSFSSHSETRSTMRDSLATSSTDDPLERLAGAELEARLLKGLEDLPESEREVLILSRFQGFRYREISEIVGLPMATVRSRIHTALDRLRNSIKDFL